MSALRFAFIGCGNIQHKHARQIKALPEAEVVGLFDPRPDNRRRLREHSLDHQASQPTEFDDLGRMYQEARPDAVIIASPHTLHYEQCVEAIDRGSHVLVEKPMVTDLRQARDLQRRVEQSGLTLCIAYNTPCSVEFATLRHHIRERTFGALRVVSLSISQPWYYLTRGSWRQDPALSGGGMIYDSGAHVLNSLTWSVESDVAEVHAYVDNLDSPVDINGTINVQFANGVMAAIAVSGQSAISSHGAFMFERGRIDLDPWGAKWMSIHDNDRGPIKYPEVFGGDRQPLSNFVDAALGRDEPRTSARHGVLQSQLMDAIYESARTGEPATPKQ